MPTLRELREQHYVSRKVLASLADVSESTIVRIEEGNTRTTQIVVEKVLHALSTKIGQEIPLESIEGLKFYNAMRDRKQRTKGKETLHDE